MRARTLFAVLLALAPASLLLSVGIGSVSIDSGELWAVLSGHDQGLNQTVVMELRLPRTLSAFATGGMLALAGALMQVLLRNPLADPYILGISGGAATATLAAMLMGAGGVWLTGSGFLGALASMLLVFGLAHGRGTWTPTRLLLTGVVIAAGWGALISFILSVAPDTSLHGMLFWLMGDLSQSDTPAAGLAVLAVGLALCLPIARNLNLLARGELQASALGVAVGQLRLHIYFVAALLTASAVTIAGSVGFVGLVVPHMLRLLAGADHRMLLPASVLAGGSLLALADTLARTVLAPQQLPVGVVTALLGVPLFLYLLNKASGRSQ